jgi:hypothetical protein
VALGLVALAVSGTMAQELPELEVVSDSLRAVPDSLFDWSWAAPGPWQADSAWTPGWGEGWERGQGKAEVGLLPVVGFSKVQGWSLGLDAGITWLGAPEIELGGTLRRVLGRERWEGFTFLGIFRRGSGQRVLPRAPDAALTGRGKAAPGSARRDPPGVLQGPGWGVVAAYGRQVVPFGANRPYGTTVLGWLLGMDRCSYLDRREVAVGTALRWRKGPRAELFWVGRRDEAIPARDVSTLLELDGEAMDANPAAEELDLRGLVLSVAWGPTEEEAYPPPWGLWLRWASWGGLLGGERRFSTAGVETERLLAIPYGTVQVRAAAAAAWGRAPRQDWPDLGGESNLRGYPPRIAEGGSSLLLQVEYRLGVDVFRRIRFPLLRRLRLQPVVFADGGAVWGEGPWRTLGRLGAPRSGDWRFDAGFGIERYVGLPGFLSSVRLEWAWRLDRASPPPRFSLRLTP